MDVNRNTLPTYAIAAGGGGGGGGDGSSFPWFAGAGTCRS